MTNYKPEIVLEHPNEIFHSMPVNRNAIAKQLFHDGNFTTTTTLHDTLDNSDYRPPADRKFNVTYLFLYHGNLTAGGNIQMHDKGTVDADGNIFITLDQLSVSTVAQYWLPKPATFHVNSLRYIGLKSSTGINHAFMYGWEFDK